ncbi:MAG TPA: hypothetical protein VJ979_03970 [Actinomycetota bacterium]|nr:hypothetical protein [Actinomycetota bacterium]
MVLVRPISRVFLMLALAVAAIACTDGDDAGAPVPNAPARSDDGLVSEDAGATEFVPGRFIFQFNSITAQATFRGSVATLNVRNGTGSQLGAPSLYVLGVDDMRYDGEVAGAAPIADGEGVSLEFRFPEAVTPETIGLAVLSFGDDTVGAMAPVPRSGG